MRNWAFEKLSNLSRDFQIVRSRAWMQTQVFVVPVGLHSQPSDGAAFCLSERSTPLASLYWVRVRVRVKTGVRVHFRISPLFLMSCLDVACPSLFWDCWLGEVSTGGAKLSPAQVLRLHSVTFACLFKDTPLPTSAFVGLVLWCQKYKGPRTSLSFEVIL